MTWPKHSPLCHLPTTLVGLAILVAVGASTRSVACEIANLRADEGPWIQPTDGFPIDSAVARAADSPTLLLAWVGDASWLPGARSTDGLLSPMDVEGDETGRDYELLDDLCIELPEWTADLLSGREVALDSFSAALAKRRASGDVWHSEIGGDFSTEQADFDRLLLLEKQMAPRKGYIARGVVDALEDFTEPSPDFLVIVVLALQSLWAVSCRRQT